MLAYKDLKKSYYVFRSVSKSYTIIQALSKWKNEGLRKIKLTFKNGTEFNEVPLGAAWALISYYYWSHQLGSYDTQDLKDLYEISNYIYDRIEKTFEHWPKNGWGMQGTHGILYAVIRKSKPNRIIETGIANGISSTVMLSAMKMNGKGVLTSVDITDKFEYIGKTQKVGWLVPSNLASTWEIKIGTTKEVLPSLDMKIDVFYHDSEHSKENMLFEFDWADKHMAQGGMLISDDIDLNSAWNLFIRDHREYNQLIKSATTGVALKAR